MSSHFQNGQQRIPPEVYHNVTRKQLMVEDDDPNKVNLTIGSYRDGNGDPWVLPVVRKVEKNIVADATLQHEYLPIRGFEYFTNAAVSLLLGADNPAISDGRAFGIQVFSGTGGLRTGAEFLSKNLHCDTFYCSSPTWDIHKHIFKNTDFTNYMTYRYWSPKTMSIDIDGLLEDLKGAPEKSVIILHGCCHNPTGLDPSRDQWEKIADVMEERKLIPFFDLPYQGLASGDLDTDAWAVRYFVKRGFELLCAQSFSKNFSLYNERVGNLTVVVKDSTCRVPVMEQLKWIVFLSSVPPAHGARIVSTILTNEHLFEEWKDNVKTMATRLFEIRQLLRAELMNLQTPGNWDHIIQQTGIFSYCGLTPHQVDYLASKYHIYMPSSGRISISGLNSSNVGYVARAIFDAVTELPDLKECK